MCNVRIKKVNVDKVVQILSDMFVSHSLSNDTRKCSGCALDPDSIAVNLPRCPHNVDASCSLLADKVCVNIPSMSGMALHRLLLDNKIVDR